MPTNAAKIIRSALSKLGKVGATERVRGEDASHCLAALNNLLDAWAVQTLLAFQRTTTVFSLPAGTASRTIGPGMQIDVARPIRIELGSFARVNGTDSPITPVSLAEFNGIARKDTSSRAPSVAYFDGGTPTGTVQFWPQAAAEVHLVTLTQLSRFDTLTTEYDLAPGYERLMVYALAEEVAPDFQVAAPASVVATARTQRNALKRQNLTVPQLVLDHGLSPNPGLPAGFFGDA